MLVINEKDPNAAKIAAEFLRYGRVISFATDTVYGIAVDAQNSRAVEALYKIKNRDEKKPIAVFLKDLAAAEEIFLFDNLAKKIAKKYFPGALTLVLKTQDKAKSSLASNLNSDSENFLGFRIVDTDLIKKLFAEFDGAIAVTSANIAGQKAAIAPQEVEKNLGNIDLLISGPTLENMPSTVVKIIDNQLTILREGALKINPRGL